MKRHQTRVRALLTALALAALAAPVMGGTRRHDVTDDVFILEAQEPEYASVGMVTQNGSTGSGVLIANDWVLTAAHVVDSGSTGMIFTLDGTDYTVSQVYPHPNWSGDLGAGWDIGLIQLETPVVGVTSAVRYRGTTELGRIGTTVGYGLRGTGLSGEETGTEGTKRAGQNMIDVLGSDPALGDSDRILIADFDSPGHPEESSFGSSTPIAMEYSTASGDSGGGLFIQLGADHQVAGITSFGEHGPVDDPDGDANADYGDLMGWTRVSSLNDWIDSRIPNYWKNPGTPAPFLVGANWTHGIVPIAGHIAVFDMMGPRTVTFGADVTNGTLHVANGDFTFKLNTHTYAVTETALVGDESGEFAKVTARSGTFNTQTAFLGRQVGAIGAVETKVGATWTNSGSVYVGGSNTALGGYGSIIVGAGTTVDVAGTLRVWNTGLDGLIQISGNASAGTFRLGGPFGETEIKSGGVLTTGSAFIAPEAGQNADVLVKGGGTWHNTGNLYVCGDQTASGGDTANGKVTVNATGLLQVDGTLKIWRTPAGGPFVVDGNATVGNLDFVSGTISGYGDLTLTGPSSVWSDGKMRCATPNTGKTIVAAGATLAVSGAEKKQLVSRTVENSGTMTWNGTGQIDVWFTSVIRNLPGGVFDLQNDASMIGDGSAGTLFDNQATLVKSAGGGSSGLDIPFDNTGTVECQSGTLAFEDTVVQHVGNTLTGGTWIARAGATLDFQTGADITTNQGNVVLDGPGSVFAKINPLADNQGGFTISSGRDFATAGGFVNGGSVTVGAGSTLTVNGPYTQTGSDTTIDGKFVAAGGAVNIGGGLTINPGTGGTMDLVDNNLIVDYEPGSSPYDEIAGWIALGCNGGTWDGTGITSSAAAAHPDKLTALGMIQNDDPHPVVGFSAGLTDLEGVPVDETAVIIKYTWAGDANLDGIVDAADYDKIDTAWLLGAGWDYWAPGPRWAIGDFNYDGLIDAADYDLIDKAWLMSGGGTLGGAGGGPVPTPEPATLVLVVLGGLGLVLRRRTG